MEPTSINTQNNIQIKSTQQIIKNKQIINEKIEPKYVSDFPLDKLVEYLHR